MQSENFKITLQQQTKSDSVSQVSSETPSERLTSDVFSCHMKMDNSDDTVMLDGRQWDWNSCVRCSLIAQMC